MAKPIRRFFNWLAGAVLISTPLATLAADDAALVERGRYLAVAGDCAACHTAHGKAPFSGGVAIASPLGTIYSTNITPSATHGIGAYTLEQFSRALRAGVRGDGSHLYPAMPYTAYAKVTDADTAALYAYFMQGVQAVDTAPPSTRLPFPFNVRLSMGTWNLMFLDAKPFEPDPAKSAEWNRGAYLAQGLAHCSTCHTPRNFLMAEKPGLYLQGASLGTWHAPDIRPGKPGWDRDTMAEYLRTGHARNGATAAGPMREAIDLSFSKMAPQDIAAIATYLDALPAPQRAAAPAAVIKLAAGDVPEMTGHLDEGERLYRNNCAACHQVDGDGLRGLPALRNHPMLRYPNADNVSMAILDGVWPEHGQGMLGFRAELNNHEVAAITNYVSITFGAGAATMDPKRVAVLRKGGESSPLLPLARVGMALAVLFAAVLLWRWRRRRQLR